MLIIKFLPDNELGLAIVKVWQAISESVFNDLIIFFNSLFEDIKKNGESIS